VKRFPPSFLRAGDRRDRLQRNCIQSVQRAGAELRVLLHGHFQALPGWWLIYRRSAGYCGPAFRDPGDLQ
jgi:hypothetical protein